MIQILGYIGKTFFNPIGWANDSLEYVKDGSSGWIPDPRPAMVFVAFCIASVRLVSRFLSVSESVRGVDVLVWSSLLVGFNAMKRAHYEKLFTKSVEQLKEELQIAKQQLDAWEKWYQTAEKDILNIDTNANHLGKVSKELSTEFKGLRETLLEGKKMFREKERRSLASQKDLGELVEKKEKINEVFSSLLEKMSESTDRQIQTLVPILKEQLAPWDQRINRLERLIKKLKEKCFSALQCPKCHHEFTPVKAIAKRKKK